MPIVIKVNEDGPDSKEAAPQGRNALRDGLGASA